ncbi:MULTISPECIES: recombinase zinc beta ribbon domain-containing protein [unclassified Paenibacillus]|uniref:recombinase zinc beta ribbon domain-containing protein n=1 Tax=unclassified Paenibacillus TaxID=185978 RepID=UPI003639FBB3
MGNALRTSASRSPFSGRNKLKYVTYRCGNRDRTKECKNPELRQEYIESYVLSQLQEKIFNDEAIPLLAKQLNDFQRSKVTGIKGKSRTSSTRSLAAFPTPR